MTDPIVEEALWNLMTIKSRTDEFFDEVNLALDYIPEDTPGIGGALQGLKLLVAGCEELWELVKDISENTGSPSRLNAAADGWTDDIAKVLNDIAGTVDPAKLETSTEWEGSGGQAYLAIVPAQGEMLSGIRDAAYEVAEALREMANVIENFWWMVAVAATATVFALGVAIAEACTIVGIPAAVATALGAIGALVAAMIGLLLALKDAYDVIEVKQQALAKQVETLGDEWPKASKKNAGKMDDGKQWDPITED